MKVHLTRGLWIENKSYGPGVQDIPEEDLRHPMFAKHIKAGHIMEVAAVRQAPAVKSQKERAEHLLEKLHSKQKKDMTPEEAELAEGGKSDGTPSFGDADSKQARSKKK